MVDYVQYHLNEHITCPIKVFKNHIYVYAKNRSDSEIIHTIKAGTEVIVRAIKPSENSRSMFGKIEGVDGDTVYSGWISLNSCNLRTCLIDDYKIEKSYYRDWLGAEENKKIKYAF